MNFRMLPPQPAEYMGSIEYWAQSRIIDPPQTLPGESSDRMYRQIPAVIQQLKAQDIQPEQLPDGHPIPRLQAAEGVVRFVVDELTWVETKKKALGTSIKPSEVTLEVQKRQFNTVAQNMETPGWYMGTAAVFTHSFMDEGCINHRQISRSVLYAAADAEHEGWFCGVGSSGLRHTGLIQKLITVANGYQDFVFTNRVGDITAHNSSEGVLYSISKGTHRVIVRSKVAAAAVYYR